MKFGIRNRIEKILKQFNFSEFIVGEARKIKQQRLILILSFAVGLLAALSCNCAEKLLSLCQSADTIFKGKHIGKFSASNISFNRIAINCFIYQVCS